MGSERYFNVNKRELSLVLNGDVRLIRICTEKKSAGYYWLNVKLKIDLKAEGMRRKLETPWLFELSLSIIIIETAWKATMKSDRLTEWARNEQKDSL